MQKIIESTLMSLDGVFGDPHIWATEYFDDEAAKCALDLLSASDAMLMGRGSYEFFAAAFPHQTGEYGDRVNKIQKYVFSNTLKKADWSNSLVISGDVVAEAAKLKEHGDGDLVIYGHGMLGAPFWKMTCLMSSRFGSIRSSWARVSRCSKRARRKN